MDPYKLSLIIGGLMKGQILSTEANCYGYILGDDKNKYYFDCRFLNKCTSFQDLGVNVMVKQFCNTTV